MKIFTMALVCLLLAGMWPQDVDSKSMHVSFSSCCFSFTRKKISLRAIQCHRNTSSSCPHDGFIGELKAQQEQPKAPGSRKRWGLCGAHTEVAWVAQPSLVLCSQIQAEERQGSLCLEDRQMGSELCKKAELLPTKKKMSRFISIMGSGNHMASLVPETPSPALFLLPHVCWDMEDQLGLHKLCCHSLYF
ncbi:C-C motif chemokine 1 [Plecturocebus cupreus]